LGGVLTMLLSHVWDICDSANKESHLWLKIKSNTWVERKIWIRLEKYCLVTGDAYDDYLRVCPFDIWPEVQNPPTCCCPRPHPSLGIMSLVYLWSGRTPHSNFWSLWNRSNNVCCFLVWSFWFVATAFWFGLNLQGTSNSLQALGVSVSWIPHSLPQTPPAGPFGLDQIKHRSWVQTCMWTAGHIYRYRYIYM
jgi:hypothetical protein